MTLPYERTRAVLQMAEQVMALAPYLHGTSETVRVPRDMLRALHRTLRHYPSAPDLDAAAAGAPWVWGSSSPVTDSTPSQPAAS